MTLTASLNMADIQTEMRLRLIFEKAEIIEDLLFVYENALSDNESMWWYADQSLKTEAGRKLSKMYFAEFELVRKQTKKME